MFCFVSICLCLFFFIAVVAFSAIKSVMDSSRKSEEKQKVNRGFVDLSCLSIKQSINASNRYVIHSVELSYLQTINSRSYRLHLDRSCYDLRRHLMELKHDRTRQESSWPGIRLVKSVIFHLKLIILSLLRTSVTMKKIRSESIWKPLFKWLWTFDIFRTNPPYFHV